MAIVILVSFLLFPSLLFYPPHQIFAEIVILCHVMLYASQSNIKKKKIHFGVIFLLFPSLLFYPPQHIFAEIVILCHVMLYASQSNIKKKYFILVWFSCYFLHCYFTHLNIYLQKLSYYVMSCYMLHSPTLKKKNSFWCDFLVISFTVILPTSTYICRNCHIMSCHMLHSPAFKKIYFIM